MLKAKKENSNNSLNKKLNNDRVTRKIVVTDELFKQLKLISLEREKSLYELLNNSLQSNLEQKTNIAKDDCNGNYKNFAINTLIFKQVKQYCIENDVSLKAFLCESLKNIL